MDNYDKWVWRESMEKVIIRKAELADLTSIQKLNDNLFVISH